MSIVVQYAPVPSSTIEQYDEVMRRLQESGEMPADGSEYHVAFPSDDQLLVTEVWDSQQQLEAFGARIMPPRQTQCRSSRKAAVAPRRSGVPVGESAGRPAPSSRVHRKRQSYADSSGGSGRYRL